MPLRLHVYHKIHVDLVTLDITRLVKEKSLRYLKGHSHRFREILILTVIYYDISNRHTEYEFQILS
jgi:hypothetical protein